MRHGLTIGRESHTALTVAAAETTKQALTYLCIEHNSPTLVSGSTGTSGDDRHQWTSGRPLHLIKEAERTSARALRRHVTMEDTSSASVHVAPPRPRLAGACRRLMPTVPLAVHCPRPRARAEELLVAKLRPIAKLTFTDSFSTVG